MSFEITRTELVWPGKYDAEGNLNVSPRISLPFQVVERVNETRATREARENREATLFDIWEGENEGDTFEDGWRNKLIWGDNKLIMESLLEQFAGKINLIYIDPPFEVGADFSLNLLIGDEKLTKQASIIEEVAYRDTWGQGTNSYLDMISKRLVLMRELLASNGAIWVHCDWRLSGVMRLLLDEIFGKENFRNEIIWWYRNAGMKAKSDKFHSKHDSLFFYSKSDEYVFNGYREPLRDGDSGKRRAYKFDSKTKKAKPVYDENGKPVYFNVDSILSGSVWDIPILQGRSEALGYPTQKPEALIERVILSTSNEGDLVADFFSGSGTTGAVSEKLNRRWICSDLGRFAIHTTRKRLLDLDSCEPFDILNLGKYERQHWSSMEFGEDLDGDNRIDFFEYVAFILKLYGATANSGSQNLHGKIDKAFVHVGSLSSPITIQEVEESTKECAAIGGKELHILGWEWEMGLMDTMTEFAKSQGVKLLARQIPREVMEEEAARKGQVQFFELAYLEVDLEQQKTSKDFVCNLNDFVISNPELIPDEVRAKIKNWSDYIDYWAIDWDFQNDTFMPEWMDYRTKKERSLTLRSRVHSYAQTGTYQVMIKVVDVFGNDTSKILDLKVK